jgi:hypothetical protein
MARRAPSRRDRRPTGREVIAFIEKFLRIPDGPNAGHPEPLSVCHHLEPAGLGHVPYHLHKDSSQQRGLVAQIMSP